MFDGENDRRDFLRAWEGTGAPFAFDGGIAWLHKVNLYVWPAEDSAERSFVKDGFAVTEWSRDGLRFAAVADISPPELSEFE